MLAVIHFWIPFIPMAFAQKSSSSQRPLWLPLALLIAALALRVAQQHQLLTGWPNVSPMMALAFVGAVVFPKPMPWWSWAVILLGVDWLSEGSAWWGQANGHLEVLLAYGCYALAAYLGSRQRSRAGVVDTLLGTLACSVMFFLVTNTLSWWINPQYAKTGAGWVQALTIGVPNALPTTMVFFRNSLVADFCGAAVLLAIYNGEAVLRKLSTMPLVGWSKPATAAV